MATLSVYRRELIATNIVVLRPRKEAELVVCFLEAKRANNVVLRFEMEVTVLMELLP